MWIEFVELRNIKCFTDHLIRLGTTKKPYPWVTLLGENGTGKSTILQAIGLMLAGPEGAGQLLKPEGWTRNEDRAGRITIKIHQGESDPGTYGGEKKERKTFQYSFNVTGPKLNRVNNKEYQEPLILPDSGSKPLSWLRTNAFQPKGTGWFGVGYGAFRRLTRANRIVVPALQTPLRHTNFASQFQEDQPLDAFETWLVYLDYQIVKTKSKLATKHLNLGVQAFNDLLPEGNSFHSVDEKGQIYFNTPQGKVRTISLSDGFRSILALAGDLVWRLIEAFPESENPLLEEGVVLIDELDIHLHPTWQRSIAGLLRKTFPNLQFIVATHSPLIAAGAGSDALTLKFSNFHGMAKVESVDWLFAKSVDEILKSEAFGLISEFSPEAQSKIDRYFLLGSKSRKSRAEVDEYQMLIPFVREALGPGAEESELEKEINEFYNSLKK